MDTPMTVILAAIDESTAALPVLRAARAMASTLGAEPRAVHVNEGAHEAVVSAAREVGIAIDVLEGEPASRIVELSADPAVAMVAVGARRHRAGRQPGHVALAVMTQVRKPVLVVPPDVRLPRSERFQRVLTPLEGTSDSTDSVAAELQALASAGADITVLHVFHSGTVPRFWDQPRHAHQSWGTEFLAQWCDQPGANVRLRRGDVAGAILDVAANDAVDLIALGWSRNMSGDRAKIVREIVSRSTLPVLLAPVRLPPVQAPGGPAPGNFGRDTDNI